MNNAASLVSDGNQSDELNTAVLIEITKSLLSTLEADDTVEANKIMDELCKMRETSLYQDIGKLTRDLHDTLNSFSHEKNFEQLANESLPDAKKRLDYVVQLTEESAHKTITVVENSLEIVNDLEKRSQALQKQVLQENEAPNLVAIQTYLTKTIDDAKTMNASLIEVLMAQSYQDVTGQVIQRVIKLVQDIEASLVAMIKTVGLNADSVSENSGSKKDNKKDSHGFGPVVPGVVHDDADNNSTQNNEVVQSQDDVDDLLSTLGF